MKKVMFALLLFVMVVGLAGSADAAADLKGMWGPGYFRPEAPVGIRFWATDMVGIDLGIGFSTDKYVIDQQEKTKTAFTIDGGVPIVVAGNETTSFFVRPGILFHSAPNPASPNDSMKDFWVSGDLGVEHFFSDRFSVQVAHGIVYESHDPGTSGSKKVNRFMTEELGISRIGFHYYLFPSK